MGKDEDTIAANSDAPHTPDEWRTIRSGVDRAHKAWIIIGPLHAVVVNWKALGIVLAIIIYINRPDIIAALKIIAGVK